MLSKNKKTKKTQNKTKVIVYSVIGIISLIVLVVYGVYETRKLSQIRNQKLILAQTEEDVSRLYDKFKSNIPEKSVLVNQPENTCNKESVKYVSFVCGTRAQLSYFGDDMSLASQTKVLDAAIDAKVFSITSKSGIKEMSSRNGQSLQYVLSDVSNGQECVINGTYLREQQKIQYHFVCNLITTQQLYKLEN